MSSLTISATDIPATNRLEAASGYTAVMSGLAKQLDALSPADWGTATDCTGWSVRDMAAHFLGAQEDLTSIRRTLQRRRIGRQHYRRLSPLDAANQQQIDDHSSDTTNDVVACYLANIPKVARRVATFPTLLSGVPVDKTMAPGGLPLRIGYLYATIYLRDSWMHSIDIARATGVPRASTEADGMVVGQILRDVSVVWSDGPHIELELTGEVCGTWRLGLANSNPIRITANGVDFCRRLSGRLPDTKLTLVAGEQAVPARLEALRILF
ncbi:maleylpyruvate isomerase family mycothiol-dependent enzyme [Arthrobacter sp. H35-D1]|uniref:maleylpyruvate isomerase family mycothiol-dependent enzyme n=1 Tax=Arthrobacter sp. H35-D1 TaxID=3046202 RepID=UPI0024B89E67|nr:maleylpyruvate isomerase family mycothiol-dependent enzyme [Arthrobacter sp. H35-D1]MDJ0314614.1 maleylpyruvate isomerase family mycothiol-dependent enzyme [Arthrobacter sp. H35-D1]